MKQAVVTVYTLKELYLQNGCKFPFRAIKLLEASKALSENPLPVGKLVTIDNLENGHFVSSVMSLQLGDSPTWGKVNE